MSSGPDREPPGDKPRTLRAEQRAFTRQRIVEAARPLFERGGYATTTIDDIAAAAGGSRGTVYRHFSGKLGVFTELLAPLEREIDERWGDLDRALETGDEEGVESWFKRELGWFRDNRGLLPARDEAFATEPEYREFLRAKVAAHESRMPAYMASWGRSERRRARIRLDLLLLQMDQFFNRWATMEPEAPDLDEVAEELASIWYPALRPPAAPAV